MALLDPFSAIPGGWQYDDEPDCEGYCSRCLMPFFDDEIPIEVRPFATDIVVYAYCDGCRGVRTGHC